MVGNATSFVFSDIRDGFSHLGYCRSPIVNGSPMVFHFVDVGRGKLLVVHARALRRE